MSTVVPGQTYRAGWVRLAESAPGLLDGEVDDVEAADRREVQDEAEEWRLREHRAREGDGTAKAQSP